MLIFLTLSATLIVKSGLSTENNISGLNLIISLTVWVILFLILNILNKMLVKPRYVISFKLKIELIPNFFKWFPPTDKYWISEFCDLSFEITVEANLSPDGSTVSMNILFF